VVGLRDSIQDRRTGLLVDTNSQALADGVIQLITDKTLYETLAVHAKKWSNAFSWEKSVRRSWKVLNGKE
jgi:glycosyltransferase involved in cell wall biosynthesis